MGSKSKQVVASLILGLGLTLGLLAMLPGLRMERTEDWIAHASEDIYCVAPGGGTHADCDQVFTNVQAAVDAASGGEEIRVAAGTYTGVQARAGVTQVVYVNKAVTIRGGYSTTNWKMPFPISQPTTLNAQGQGRVLYITDTVRVTIEGLRITGGNAAGMLGDPSGEDAGGGLYGSIATVTISNTQIASNVAQAGGGVYLLNSPDSTLAGNIISNNQGLNRAGGVYFRNSPRATLIANAISDNFANHVGAGQKHNGGVYFLSSDDATVLNNTVSGNWAADRCGGLCFRNSDNARLIGNRVMGNEARARNIGGLLIESGSNARLMGNIIMANRACSASAGMLLSRNDATLINNVVADNVIRGERCNDPAPFVGSGLYISSSSPHLLHTTIARNSGGDGSGAYVTDDGMNRSAVNLTNTILVSQAVGIAASANNVATLNGVLWYGNTLNTSGPGAIHSTNAYTGNPAFFASDGYHLRHNSAAIDKGLESEVMADIDGQRRSIGAAPDLGADEANVIFLPIILK